MCSCVDEALASSPIPLTHSHQVEYWSNSRVQWDPMLPVASSVLEKGVHYTFLRLFYGEEMFISLKLSDLRLGGRKELSWGEKECC